MADPWSHTDKEWQETLDLARALGYPTPTVLNAHGGLLLKCPGGDKRHGKRIYSTAKGTENVARTTRATIRSCHHRDLQEPLGKARLALDDAERWISAAEHLREFQNVEALLADILDGLEAAESALADADAAFEDLAEEHTHLEATLEDDSALLSFDITASTPRKLADRAGPHLRDVRLVMRDQLPKPTSAGEDVQALSQRYKQLRSRLESVRK